MIHSTRDQLHARSTGAIVLPLKRRNFAMKMNDPAGCPFCGEPPTVEPWHGGGKHKTAVHCENEKCPAQPMVTGANLSSALTRWNTRNALKEHQP